VVTFEKASYDELDYLWEAVYTTGETLKQFDKKNKIENQFKDIDQNILKSFILTNKKNPFDKYAVSLLDGFVYAANSNIIAGEYISKTSKIKLIYFRRIQRKLNAVSKPKITYFLGWHGKVNNKYKKHQIAISSDGNYIIAT